MGPIDFNVLPEVEPPWIKEAKNQTQQQTPPTQNSGSQQNQSQIKPDNSFDFGDAADLIDTGFKAINKGKGLFGSAPSAVGGAASGAVSAGGGTYVTGPGLAGTASPINTTAGAAGTSSGGLASGLKGGLATAGVGIAAGFLGDKIFGGYGAAGSSLGATIGLSLGGPLGALGGGLLGGAVGGLFGSGPKNSYYRIGFGNTGMSGMDVGQVYKTDLGDIKIYGHRQGGEAVDPSVKAITESDAAVAKLFDPSQLDRAKAGIANADYFKGTKWTTHPERAQGVLEDAVKARYASAVGGLQTHFGTVFSRVANDENMGGLISTFAQIDRDMQNGTNVFAGHDVKNGEQAIDIIAQTYGLAKQKPKLQQMSGDRPTEIPKPSGPPRTPTSLTDNTRVVPGWEWKISLGGLSSGWVKIPSSQASGMSAQMGYDNVLRQQQQLWDLEKQKIDEANNKAMAAWETKVLDAYVNNHADKDNQTQADNIGQIADGIDVNRPAQDDSIPDANRVQSSRNSASQRLFGEVKQQTVKLNRATPISNPSTNAGGLLSRSGVI